MVTVIDESISLYLELQQIKQVLPPLEEFGKKVAVEKDIARAGFNK